MVLSRQSDEGGSPAPLGRLAEIKNQLAQFNTAPDGSRNTSLGLERLHGPGFVVDLPTSIDEPMQIMVAVKDAETAWPVLSRICKTLHWSLTDAESGRIYL